MAGAPPPPPPSPNPPPSASPIPPPSPGWTPAPPRTPVFYAGALESLAIRWGRILGFVLLFLGTLVAVAAGSIEPGCFPSGCPSSYGSTWAWAVLVGELLWTIALFFLGASSGLQLMTGLRAPVGGTPEEYRWVQTERWFNFLMVALSIVLLWFLLSGIQALAIRPTGG